MEMAARWLELDEEVRVIVVKGRGPSFCAGYHMTRHARSGEAGDEFTKRAERDGLKAAMAWREQTFGALPGHDGDLLHRCRRGQESVEDRRATAADPNAATIRANSRPTSASIGNWSHLESTAERVAIRTGRSASAALSTSRAGSVPGLPPPQRGGDRPAGDLDYS